MSTLRELAAAVEALLPAHACGCYIEHNANRDVYETVRQAWEGAQWKPPEFRSEDQKQRAFDTNEVWVLRWYRTTPVGFSAIAAPTLAELLEWIAEEGKR